MSQLIITFASGHVQRAVDIRRHARQFCMKPPSSPWLWPTRRLVCLLHRRMVRCEATSPARIARLAPEGRRWHGSYARRHSCARDFALGGNAARLLRHGLIAEASRPWLACGGYTRSLFPSILDPVSCPLPLVVSCSLVLAGMWGTRRPCCLLGWARAVLGLNREIGRWACGRFDLGKKKRVRVQFECTVNSLTYVTK